MRVVIATTLLLFAGCFQFSRAQQTASTPNPPTSLSENVLNAEIKSARGPSFRLADFAGKVLIINFWATWAGPSRMEAPLLIDLQKHYWSRGVRVVGLNTENVED
jgi:thiol-disulfide isomerase/thioredoxin